MEAPRPTTAHHQLARLVGVWRGREIMHPSPWDERGGQAEGETRSRVALGGFAVISDYHQVRAGKVVFEGHGVYSIDAKTAEVVLHWFDGMGQGAEVFRGGWQGDRLTLTSHGAMGSVRLEYDFGRAGRLGSRMEMAPDGERWATLFECDYARVAES